MKDRKEKFLDGTEVTEEYKSELGSMVQDSCMEEEEVGIDELEAYADAHRDEVEVYPSTSDRVRGIELDMSKLYSVTIVDTFDNTVVTDSKLTVANSPEGAILAKLKDINFDIPELAQSILDPVGIINFYAKEGYIISIVSIEAEINAAYAENKELVHPKSKNEPSSGVIDLRKMYSVSLTDDSIGDYIVNSTFVFADSGEDAVRKTLSSTFTDAEIDKGIDSLMEMYDKKNMTLTVCNIGKEIKNAKGQKIYVDEDSKLKRWAVSFI